MNRILTVRYKESVNAEDLFYCPETKKVYIRKPSNDESAVFWLTSSKWTGGYEADSPIRAGITMRVVDSNGNILFEETLESNEYNGETSAKKKGDFSYQAIKKIAAEFGKGLVSHKDWRNWVLSDKEKYGNTDYNDTWVYGCSETVKRDIVGRKSFLGVPALLAKDTRLHKISGKKWVEYLVLASDEFEVYEIAGYELKSNGNSYN